MTSAESALYARLLGPAWDRLHPGLRAAHATGGAACLSGRFRVEVGSGLLARMARSVLRIPLQPGEFPARLSVHRQDGAETWERLIGTWSFSTRQSEWRGILRERYGPLLFDLRLEEIDGGLKYTQIGLRFSLGPFRIHVPRALAARVSAREEGAAEPLISNLSVRLELSLVGLLVAYGGTLGSG